MYHQQYISQIVVQSLLKSAGLPRVWTAYPADKIEEVLRGRGLIDKNTVYTTFNPVDNYLVFSSQEYIESKFKFTWKERFKILFKGML